MLKYLICFLLGILLYIYYNINEKFSIGAGPPPHNVYLFKLPQNMLGKLNTDLTTLSNIKVIDANSPSPWLGASIPRRLGVTQTFVDFVDSRDRESNVVKLGWEMSTPINMVYKFKSTYYFISQYDQHGADLDRVLDAERERNRRVNDSSKKDMDEIERLYLLFKQLTNLRPPDPVQHDLVWLRNAVKYLKAKKKALSGTGWLAENPSIAEQRKSKRKCPSFQGPGLSGALGNVYRVVSPDGALVREHSNKTSQAICKLEKGASFEVLETVTVGNNVHRLRFTQPGIPVGWVSITKNDGTVLCEPDNSKGGGNMLVSGGGQQVNLARPLTPAEMELVSTAKQIEAESKCAFEQCKATKPTGSLGNPPSGKAPKPCSKNGKVALTQNQIAAFTADANAKMGWTGKNVATLAKDKADVANEIKKAEEKAITKAISEETARNKFLKEMHRESSKASAAAKVTSDNKIKEGDLIAWIGIDNPKHNHRKNGAVVVPANPGILSPTQLLGPHYLIIRPVGEDPPDWIPGATVRGTGGSIQNPPGLFFIIRNNSIIGMGGHNTPIEPYLSYLAPCLNRYYPLDYGNARGIFTSGWGTLRGSSPNISNMNTIIGQLIEVWDLEYSVELIIGPIEQWLLDAGLNPWGRNRMRVGGGLCGTLRM